MKLFYSLLFLLLTTVSCKKETSKTIYPTDKKITIENQIYGENARNLMDIYLSKNRNANTKTIIFIHGGGWKEGDKTDFKDFASLSADSGVNSITINYRYADASKAIGYNEILTDIAKAISFLKSNSNKYGSNFNEITLFGISAGGHLSLLYSYKCGNIKNVISMAGPTDFNDPEILSISGMPELLNNVVGSSSEQMRMDASPVTYANNTTTYLYHGKLDVLVPYSQSQKLFNKISPLNAKNKLTLFPDCGHGFNDQAIFQIFQETINLVKK